MLSSYCLLAIAIRCFELFTCFQILHKIWKFCKKFGQLILRKIFKFIATRCQTLRLKLYTKLNFGWGYAPDHAKGPSLLAEFRGPASKGREGVGHGKVEGEKGGQGMEWEGTEEKRTSRVGSHPHEKYPDCRTDLIGGASTQTFAPGGKHSRAATGRQTKFKQRGNVYISHFN